MDCVTVTDFASLGEGDSNGIVLDRPYVVVGALPGASEKRGSSRKKCIVPIRDYSS